MIAYLILSHGDTVTLQETISAVYHPNNIYCVCCTKDIGTEMLDALGCLRRLGNVHLLLVPPTSWGMVLEAYLRGIEFCLKFSNSWSSLIIMSGTDVAPVSQEKIFDLLNDELHNKIVLETYTQPAEICADIEIVNRLLSDPFAESESRYDNAIYNPFTSVRPNYNREGSIFFAESGAMRAGWTQTSHFVTALVQNRRDTNGDVYSEIASPFSRRALNVFFQRYPPAGSSVYGIFPRDFCGFLTSAPVSLELLSLIRQSFAAEELYFATLAYLEPFCSRLISRNITFRVPGMDRRLTIEDILSNFLYNKNTDKADQDENIKLSPGPYLFARKAPSDNKAKEFYASIRFLFGRDLNSDLNQLCNFTIGARKDFVETLFRVIDPTLAPFMFGVLGGPRIDCEKFLPNGLIEHQNNTSQSLGNTWLVTNEGLATEFTKGEEFARFESFRVKAGKFLLFGYWQHHPMATLCLETNLTDILRCQELEYDDLIEKSAGLLLGFEWEFWLNQEMVDVVKFEIGGFVSIANEREIGHWRVVDDRMVVIGLGYMPVAIFDIEKLPSKQILCGVSWGRESAREPCILRRR